MPNKIIYTHKHHIIPRHAGGTDDPSNIVELTIPEHAEAHRVLYEKYGRWQDKIAWQGLSGRIGKEEIIRRVASEANKGSKNRVGKKHSEETKIKMSEAYQGQKPFLGKKHSEESKRKISEKRKGKKPNLGNKHSEETKRKIGEINKIKLSGIPQPKVECPHCGLVGGKPIMYRYHFDKCKHKS